MFDASRGPSRREFLKTGVSAAVTAATAGALPVRADPTERPSSETLVAQLYRSLSDAQKRVVCFAWDYQDRKRGLLRTYISNNWRITAPAIRGNAFYTRDQQDMIRAIFEGLVNPDWLTRWDRQFRDDMGGFGVRQGIAIFGTPGTRQFEFVLSGRHGTIRCDGNSAEHVCFGGPILYGHEGSGGYYEAANHADNVFWHQAVEANRIYQMLDGRQRSLALQPQAPDEAEVGFRATDRIEGIPVTELSADQKEHLQRVLRLLLEPYRQSDRDEAVTALNRQGGLDRCFLTFYRRDDLGNDGIWDNWRLEGPAFVWHYRGAPHVHVWVNVADDPGVALNAENLSGPLRRQ
jgi:hypothetical protein